MVPGCSAFARRYLQNLGWFLFLWVLRCFSSPGSPPIPMYSVLDDPLTWAGFPHSDILASKSVADSTRLFAGYYVFHRLLLPRHPPYALNYLTIQLKRTPSLGTSIRGQSRPKNPLKNAQYPMVTPLFSRIFRPTLARRWTFSEFLIQQSIRKSY